MSELGVSTELGSIGRRRRVRSPGLFHHNHIDLWIAVVISVISLLISFVGLEGNPYFAAVHFVVGLAMFLLVPGYVSTTGLFPTRVALPGIERWGLGIVISAVLYILFGMVMSWLGIPFTSPGVGSASTLWTLVFAGISYFRRKNLPIGDAYVLNFSGGPFAYTALIVTLFAMVGVYALHISAEKSISPSLSITSTDGLAIGYPFILDKNERIAYRLNLSNPSPEPVRYRMSELLQGVDVAAWVWNVPADGKVSRLVSLPTQDVGKQRITWEAQPVQASLPHPQVWIWYTVR